jgi:acyl carrier protein
MHLGTDMATTENMIGGAAGNAPPQQDVEDRIRSVLRAQAQLQGSIDTLDASSSLYEAGMTSRASVAVMLALEGEFEIEFPDAMLRRDVFESVTAIRSAVLELLGGQ